MRAAAVLAVLSVPAALRAATYNGAAERLQKFKNTGALSFGGDSSSLLLVGVLLGLGTVLFFAYLYWREWRLERQFRQAHLAAGEGSLAMAAPAAPAARKPLIKSPKPGKNGANGLALGSGPQNRSASPTLDSQAPHEAPANSSLSISAPEEGRGPTARVVNIRGDELQEIFVDGEFVGTAPARLTLPEGRHTVVVRQEGREHFRCEMSIIAGAEVSLGPFQS